MMGLRAAGAVLLVACGWLAGDAVQTRCRDHVRALSWAVWLVQRLRQEIAYQQADLELLYRQLCREDPGLPPQGSLDRLPLPRALTPPERSALEECLAGLGRATAEQECERLDYYRLRLEKALAEADRQEKARAALTHRLGLAAGAVLALWLI